MQLLVMQLFIYMVAALLKNIGHIQQCSTGLCWDNFWQIMKDSLGSLAPAWVNKVLDLQGLSWAGHIPCFFSLRGNESLKKDKSVEKNEKEAGYQWARTTCVMYVIMYVIWLMLIIHDHRLRFFEYASWSNQMNHNGRPSQIRPQIAVPCIKYIWFPFSGREEQWL